MHVLVTYASRHGSTAGVAQRLARKLAERGIDVDLRPVGEVDDLGAYGAIVFGSPVYDQSWPPEADAFVRDHRDALARLPVWLFSVGTFGDDKRLIGPLMRREPKGIGRQREKIRPRDYRVFAGVIERHQWPFLSRVFFHALGGRLGDNRNWETIDAWADSIAQTLRTDVGAPARRVT